jgi:hypothetical protein
MPFGQHNVCSMVPPWETVDWLRRSYVSAWCFDSEVLELAGKSVARMHDRLARFAPRLAAETDTWTRALSPTGEARDYFVGGKSNLLLLPLFLREACQREADRAFELDLAYSTLNAYYFVRLIDDVVDGSPSARSPLLPLLGFFHSEFQSTYVRYFPPDSVFGEFFHCTWVTMAEATVEQTRLLDLSKHDFIRLSAAKSGGVKIPLAAVCERYGRPDLLQRWCTFFDEFAAWGQMLDDVFDWLQDYTQAVPTYFLSEARRRKRHDESVASWILREGIEWGYAHAARQMGTLRNIATELESENLVRYINHRQTEVAQLWETLRPQLPALARLALAFEG